MRERRANPHPIERMDPVHIATELLAFALLIAIGLCILVIALRIAESLGLPQ